MMYAYLYDQQSESGNALVQALGIRKISHENSRYRGSPDRTVLNWGSSRLPFQVRRSTCINAESAVAVATNKLWSFRCLGRTNVRIPQWTEDYQEARRMIPNGGVVYARNRLKGHDGEGVIVCRTLEDLRVNRQAKLFVKGLNITDEYRVTVAFGRVIGVQKKVRADDHDGPMDNDIRTTDGGWGFRLIATNNLRVPAMRQLATDAVAAIGLDFGGVDIVIDGNTPYVLEINTAPQLTPVMVDRLAAAIREEHPVNEQE